MYNFRRKIGVWTLWWAYGSTLFDFEKGPAIPNAFLALPIINWWIINDLQFLGDPSWATDARATMKQTDRCKGRKESLET